MNLKEVPMKLLEKSGVETNSVLRIKREMSEAARKEMAALVNEILSEALELQTQCKEAQESVKDCRFVPLHRLLDDLSGDVEKCSEKLAGRLDELDGALGRSRVAAGRDALKDHPLAAGRTESTEAFAGTLSAFGKHAHEAVEKAVEAGDLDTAGLLTEISRGVDRLM